MKKMKLAIVTVFLMSLALFGCSILTNVETTAPQNDAGFGSVTTMEVEKADSDAGQGLLIGEKVITTVYLSYETLEYEKSVDYLNDVVAKYNAYIEYSYEYKGENGTYSPTATAGNFRQGDYTIRIPNESVDSFMTDLQGKLGTKISEQVGNQDVTQSYEDIETRISVLQRKEERLLALLEQAETIEQILAIEDSLSATIAEREVLQSELDNMDDLIDYTALYLTVYERSRITTDRGGAIPFWGRVKDAFLDAIYAFYYWIQDAAIWLIYALPFVASALLLLLLYWLIKKMFFKTRWGKQRKERQINEKKMIEERRKEKFTQTHPKKRTAGRPTESQAVKPAPTETVKETKGKILPPEIESHAQIPEEQSNEGNKREK